ncbi:MAG TPA: CoA pyrophosphatase [Anaeromyxobacteraceae bacterium]|nr:CoA pyrophosphatase [Anaeromyxobacteraceae bacterium]
MRLRSALSSRPPRRLAVDGFAAAAVLVPLLRRPAGPTLLFTRRTADLSKHRGEIAFPGGHREPGEEARAAALREAGEEVGLEPRRVEVAGELDDRPVVTRFVVTPVVGLVAEPPAAFSRDAREVEEVFEVPLSRFLDPEVERFEWWHPSRLPPDLARRPLSDLGSEEIDPESGSYKVYFFDVAPDRVVWGLTARLVRDLLERLRPTAGAPAHGS